MKRKTQCRIWKLYSENKQYTRYKDIMRGERQGGKWRGGGGLESLWERVKSTFKVVETCHKKVFTELYKREEGGKFKG